MGRKGFARGLLRPFKRLRAEPRRAAKFERQLRDLDAEAQTTIRRVASYTMLTPDKLFALIQAVRHVYRSGLEGAIVECGVWRGGAVMAAALTAAQLGDRGRGYWLYDTFSGMTQPSREEDFALVGSGDPSAEFARRRTGPDSSAWCLAGQEEVRVNLAATGLPPERFRLVAGKVEETIPAALPGPIAVLRLDTDWYESTRHEMEHLFPLLVRGGVLLVDDYFRWAGNRRAVDEYLEAQRVPMLLTKVGRSAVGVRP